MDPSRPSNESTPLPEGASSDNVEVPVHRQPKPRPDPLDFPDEPQVKPVRGAAVAGYGTFVTPEKGATAAAAYQPRQARGSNADQSLWEYLTSPQSPLIQIRDHCHHQWVAVLLTVVLLALILFTVFWQGTPASATGCNSEFGTYLGEHAGVRAFSNCKYNYTGDGLDHYVSIGLQRVYTGAKWRALEFARRYWVMSRLITFPSLPSPEVLFNVSDALVLSTATMSRQHVAGAPHGSATAILNKGDRVMLQHYFNLQGPQMKSSGAGGDEVVRRGAGQQYEGSAATSKAKDERGEWLWDNASSAAPQQRALRLNANGVPLREFVLDRSTARPREGDLLVYQRDRKTLRQGHVAVVVGVQGPFRSLANAGHRILLFVDQSEGGLRNASASAQQQQQQPVSPDVTLIGTSTGSHATRRDVEEERDGETNITAAEAARGPDSAKKNRANDDNGAGNGAKTKARGAVASGRTAPGFPYRRFNGEEDCLFYRVYLAEQNWNNKPWVDDVVEGEGKKRSQQLHRGFSRAVLLREYYPSRLLYIEDNSGQRIMGWVRAAI